MINDYLVIAVVPARGGSKSIHYKNLHPLNGKPLIFWSIDCALKTPEIDRLIVSTEDDRIRKAALDFGAEVYLRPEILASDNSLVADTIRHLWKQLLSEGAKKVIFVLLEPTSPFRTPQLIRNCLRRLVNENIDSIATFHDAEINPERTWQINGGVPQPFIPGSIPWMPRQLLMPAYQLNGAIYAFYPDRLPEEIPNLLFGKMGAEIVDADQVIDIDTAKDFVIANAIFQS